MFIQLYSEYLVLYCKYLTHQLKISWNQLLLITQYILIMPIFKLNFKETISFLVDSCLSTYTMQASCHCVPARSGSSLRGGGGGDPCVTVRPGRLSPVIMRTVVTGAKRNNLIIRASVGPPRGGMTNSVKKEHAAMWASRHVRPCPPPPPGLNLEIPLSHSTRGPTPRLGQCWAGVGDACPALAQPWMIISFLIAPVISCNVWGQIAGFRVDRSRRQNPAAYDSYVRIYSTVYFVIANNVKFLRTSILKQSEENRLFKWSSTVHQYQVIVSPMKHLADRPVYFHVQLFTRWRLESDMSEQNFMFLWDISFCRNLILLQNSGQWYFRFIAEILPNETNR